MIRPQSRPGRDDAPGARQVCALATVLEEEFEAPFRFYSADGEEIVAGPPSPEGAWRPARASVLALLREGQARVELLPDGRFELGAVLGEGREAAVAAVAALHGHGLVGREQERERRRLERWLRAVCGRIRLAEHAAAEGRRRKARDAQLGRAWSALLVLNDAVSQLRVHRGAEGTQRFVLRSARSLFEARAALWVPRQGGEMLVEGDAALSPWGAACPAEWLARAARGLRPGEPIVYGERLPGPRAERLPRAASLLAAPAHEAGWLVLLNKGHAARASGGRPPDEAFDKDDAVMALPLASLLEAAGRASRRYGELREVFVGLTRSLVTAIDARDPSALGRSERVARVAVEVGRELGLPGDELNDLYLAGLLHDVGKVGVRDAVLQKQGPLSPEEYEHVKRHVAVGHDLLCGLRPLRKLLPGVLHHHERFDGGGYPLGLAGEEIPLPARILAVADAFDAMSSPRPYREAMPPHRVEECLRQGAGSQWDERVVAALLRWRAGQRPVPKDGDSLQRVLEEALSGPGEGPGVGPLAYRVS